MKHNTIKKEWALEGLGCGNCAEKMESQINKLQGVQQARVDFIAKKLTLEIDEKQEITEIVKEAARIMDRIEPGVRVQKFEKARGKEKSFKDDKEQEQSKEDRIRLGFGGALFAVAMIVNLSENFSLGLFVLSYIIVGGGILLRAAKNIARGQVFDENFLMSIATLGAFAIGEYPEAVAVMLFYRVGEYFQNIAVNRSRKSIGELMDIRPDFAHLKTPEGLRRVTPEEVAVGDRIMIKPGERVPLDGIVLEGTSAVDTSALTGESLPREVKGGSTLLSGFINKNGVLTMDVTKEFEDSTVSKILDLVENASSRKAPTENFITKFARYYTPVVVITALLLAVIPPLVLPGALFSQWIYRGLVFLVISCPCALVISIPLGFFGGIGGASKRGILIKGSNYLEALNNVETVIFDKTGTLTEGVFKVRDIVPEDANKREELLKYAAYAEGYSNHPIGISVVEAYNREIETRHLSNYQEIPGHGIMVNYRDEEILAGNRKLMDRENIEYKGVKTLGTIIYIAVNQKYMGYIEIADEIKKDGKEAVDALKALGVKNTVMLTGDSKAVGEAIGRKLGIDKVYGELLPDQKVQKLEEIEGARTTKGKVLFVGDGINDAPVLARADVGVAMGGLGSDAAIEAADLVIMNDEPSKIAKAIGIGRRTRKIVWQNIILALGVKLVFLILGAMGKATLWEAVFADVGVALLAILNAMRVMQGKDD
ncbi:heavy metal translocating P-type ATPase [Isachenkonia alkalipeptolytica]|uniref:Cadmium-translocating P-type ATPase n=1 Tax=Isachenkonia alkalipeptolytica TaxID=2565777 RepID=A0AA43XJB0_9CLOT|nr:heavy metal translocating P-type ATPase [Isachenkonia alkalipeptolytica]NBG87294.1 cadmium-translocating P-type ATPase [Isachenkonia alkalipeptolytica]